MWSDNVLVGFDTETTGVNPKECRLVTAAIVIRCGLTDRVFTWLADPGVEIPEAAAKVHGITTEKARAEGHPARVVLDEVASILAAEMRLGHPIVIYNAPYDLTLMEAELTRHQLPTLAQRIGSTRYPVIDPLVLDKTINKYRKGKRTLGTVVGHYGVPERTNLHTAEVDVMCTLDLIQAMARKPDRLPDGRELRALSLDELYDFQVGAHAAWAADFQDWCRRRGDDRVINGDWPLVR